MRALKNCEGVSFAQRSQEGGSFAITRKVSKLTFIALAAVMAFAALALGACSSQQGSSSASTSAVAASSSSSATSVTSSSASGSSSSAASLSTSATASNSASQSGAATATTASLGAVPNTIAQDEAALVSAYPSKFQQVEYTDAETGLSVTYNLFLPEGYDASASYPMVVFIGDSTCAGTDTTRSLTQGLGALVWATDEWQAVNPTIVCVPAYPETILDDHNGYTTTEYVELTKRLIESVSGEYAVDKNRIYGTGQSMGCMTTLILASEYPDLYAACMFVDGQWDITALKGLENQTFVYFAAEDDKSAFSGMSEVMNMFSSDAVPYSYAQWDGAWSPDELSVAAQNLFAEGNKANFISWKTGTIDASSASMGGSGGMGGGPGGGAGGPSASGGASANAGISSASASSSQASGGEGSSSAAQGSAGGSGMGSVGYHMASFDYAYNCVAVMEWLFQQSK